MQKISSKELSEISNLYVFAEKITYSEYQELDSEDAELLDEIKLQINKGQNFKNKVDNQKNTYQN